MGRKDYIPTRNKGGENLGKLKGGSKIRSAWGRGGGQHKKGLGVNMSKKPVI